VHIKIKAEQPPDHSLPMGDLRAHYKLAKQIDNFARHPQGTSPADSKSAEPALPICAGVHQDIAASKAAIFTEDRCNGSMTENVLQCSSLQYEGDRKLAPISPHITVTSKHVFFLFVPPSDDLDGDHWSVSLKSLAKLER